MTDEAIQNCLLRLNRSCRKGRIPKDIIIAPIAEGVWWGFVWGRAEVGLEARRAAVVMPGDIEFLPSEFYFVQAPDGSFAGAVLVMGFTDLHLFVLKACRGQKLLVRPLKQVILPHRFVTIDNASWEKNRKAAQRVTVDLRRPWGEHAIKLVKRIGFEEELTKESTVHLVAYQNQFPRFRFRRSDQSLTDLHQGWFAFRRSLRQVSVEFSKLRVAYLNAYPSPAWKHPNSTLTSLAVDAEDVLRGAEVTLKARRH